ncbi:hypothetical protein [Streptomyces wuyuanensis]
MCHGEVHIGHAHVEEFVAGLTQRVGEEFATLARHRRQQPGLVAEVVL